MLVGFSLLVVFASFFVYRHPFASWTLPWLNRQAVTGGSSKSGEERVHTLADRGDDEKETESTKELLPQSPEGTPKVVAYSPVISTSIPSFSLQEDDGPSDEDEDNMPPPSFPAINSAQRASVPSSRSLTLTSQNIRASDATLMPPPPLAVPRGMGPPSLRLSTSNYSASRVSSNGPLPNRGPPDPLSVPNTLAAPITAATVTPNPRKKVTLRPGYSPLDWAELARNSPNLSGVDKLTRVTPAMLKQMNGRKNKPAWSSYHGRVYNITPYLPYHPGGEGELRRAAGKDGGKLFAEVHPWVNWEGMLAACVVGIMVGEGEGEVAPSPLEEMD